MGVGELHSGLLLLPLFLSWGQGQHTLVDVIPGSSLFVAFFSWPSLSWACMPPLQGPLLFHSQSPVVWGVGLEHLDVVPPQQLVPGPQGVAH